MDEFQPRIEEPPEREIDKQKIQQSKNQQLRDFVKAAAGKWCLVAEERDTTKKTRQNFHAKFWGVFMRIQGFEDSGFQIRSHYIDRVLKVYARFDESKVMKSPQ